MESASLTKAHDHAREASLATNMADTVVAVNEHILAAGEFASAAHDTSSIEALRTLRLLEQHHERLAQLLQHSLEHPPEQRQKAQTDTRSLKEKDAGVVAGGAGDAHQGEKTGTLGSMTGKTTAATASVSGMSGDKTATKSSVGTGNGNRPQATGPDGALLGGDGAASVRLAAGDGAGDGAGSVSLAAASSASTATQQAGATAVANILSQQQQRRHPPSRELSSSIANNLASARGIRSSRYHRGQPAAPSVSTDQAPGSLDGQVLKVGGSRAQMQSVLRQQKQQQQPGGVGKPSWVPPKHPQRIDAAETDVLGPAENGSGSSPRSKSDEGFARFYDRFGSFINRLSAPLAFAGLPLITEEAGASTKDATTQKAATSSVIGGTAQRPGQLPSSYSATTSHARSSSSSSAAEPDLTQIYSKAALRAINRDGLGSNPSDSFYVVPKTGHTASYANILSFEQKEQRRRLAASAVLVRGDEAVADELGEEDDDENGFADARSSSSARPPAARPGLIHRLTAADSRTASNRHLVEELTTENESLKDMLDRLSRRLHAFEASAQQSHMALQESMRFMQPGSAGDTGSATVTKATGGAVPSLARTATALTDASEAADAQDSLDTLALKNKDLEIELSHLVQRLDASERERAHQEKTLQKYRDKWEKLKAGAKARRDAQGGGSEGR